MAEVDDLDEVLEQWQLAVDEFHKGNPKPTQELFSHREDVTLANPLGPAAPEIGPVAHGWEQVARTQEHAASQFTDGQLMSSGKERPRYVRQGSLTARQRIAHPPNGLDTTTFSAKFAEHPFYAAR